MAKNKFSFVWIILVVGLIAVVGLFSSYFKGQPYSISEGSYSFQGNNSEGKVSTLKPFDVVLNTACTPESGYNFCWEYEYDQPYTFGSTTALAKSYTKLQIFDSTKNRKAGYVIGDAYLKYKITGDKAYLYNNSQSWNDFFSLASCGKSGCNNGQQIPLEGIVNITPAGTTRLGYCPKILAFDYDTAKQVTSDGNYTEWASAWAYSTQAFGWVGNPSCNFVAIKCYDDSDCSIGFCSKVGVPTSWECKTECTAGQTKCDGVNSYVCSDKGQWVNKGAVLNQCGVECLAGQTKCDGKNYLSCANNKFSNQGIVVSQCGVQCLSNQSKCSDFINFACENNLFVNKGNQLKKCNVNCLSDSDCSTYSNKSNEPICKGGELYQSVNLGYCDKENFKCASQATEQLYAKCMFGCTQNNECRESTQGFIYSLGIFTIVAIGLTIYFVSRRRK